MNKSLCDTHRERGELRRYLGMRDRREIWSKLDIQNRIEVETMSQHIN